VVMGEPPFEAGGVKVIVICALPATTETRVGAPAKVRGTAAADAGDGEPGPSMFVAVTVHV